MSTSGSFGVPEVNSKIVQNDSGSYDMDNVTSSNLPPFNMKAGVGGKFNLQILCSYYSIIAVYSIGNKSYYGVRIVNGSQAASGTNDTGIHIILVGSNGCTEKLYLAGWCSVFGGVGSASKYEDLVVQTDKDLGDVKVLLYGNDANFTGLFNNEWYVEFSVVYPLSSAGKDVEFPCYHWIGDGETISTTSATSEYILYL